MNRKQRLKIIYMTIFFILTLMFPPLYDLAGENLLACFPVRSDQKRHYFSFLLFFVYNSTPMYISNHTIFSLLFFSMCASHACNFEL